MKKTTLVKLIDKATTLSARIKALENDLHCIKCDIETALPDESGKMETEFSTLSYTTSCRFTDVSIPDARKALKKINKLDSLDSCVSVKLTPLKKLIGEAVLNDLRTVKGSSLRMTFKSK